MVETQQINDNDASDGYDDDDIGQLLNESDILQRSDLFASAGWFSVFYFPQHGRSFYSLTVHLADQLGNGNRLSSSESADDVGGSRKLLGSGSSQNSSSSQKSSSYRPPNRFVLPVEFIFFRLLVRILKCYLFSSDICWPLFWVMILKSSDVIAYMTCFELDLSWHGHG